MPVRLSLLVTLGILVTIRVTSPLRLTTVYGRSMEPALRSGGVYLLDRSYYRSHPLCRGDIVVFRKDGETYIKRVYALPGERVWLLRSGEGDSDEILEAPQAACLQRVYAERGTSDCRVFPLTITAGHCYVLGDNSANSIDSRHFGPVPIRSILGHILE